MWREPRGIAGGIRASEVTDGSPRVYIARNVRIGQFGRQFEPKGLNRTQDSPRVTRKDDVLKPASRRDLGRIASRLLPQLVVDRA